MLRMDTSSISSQDIAMAVRGVISRVGETVESTAAKAGITRTTMTRRMTGQSSFTVDEVVKVAAALDVPLSQVFRDAEALAVRRARLSA